MTYLRKGVLLSLLVLIGCETQGPSTKAPSNLLYQINLSTQEQGLVDVIATADDCNYFTFKFGEDPNATLITEANGIGQHQFSATGHYPLRIRAHGSFDVYTEAWDTIDVDIVLDTAIIPSTGYSTPLVYSGYSLVWQDEFEGSTLSSDWSYEIGNGNWGWGNDELEYYRQENTVVRQGCLIITAKEENFGGFNYTSSRLVTQGAQSFKYGRIDIRAALPSGQGLWPALWMLGDNFSTVGWPACGEIDIMEMIGGATQNQGDERVHGTGHWSQSGNHASAGSSIAVTNGSSYQDEFHVFSIVWNASSIKWYRDDVIFYTLDITSAELSEFHEKFFFIFNVAVGGNWPGSPNAQTTFPQRMAVDYIRVFQP